jgi:hypothetical protein
VTPTLEEMRTQLRRELGAFRERYGHVGVTYRGHSVIWVGWTEMAQYLRENGVRLDTDFSAGRYFRGGYGNGSGLPVKFMDEDGRLLDIYEQCTLSTDDGWTTEKLFYPAMSIDECIALSTKQMDEAVQTYHTVYHPYFHPLATRPGPRSAERWQETMLARGRERGLHFVSGADWVAFNDGRRGVRLAASRFDPAALVLELELEAELRADGLALALPAVFRGAGLVQATVDGEPVPAEPQSLEGRRQVLLPADYAAGQRRRWRVAWGHGSV